MRLTDLFFVVVYLSVIGGLFGVASLFVSHIFGRVRGLWLPLCGMALYLLPVLSPEVWLFSPEPEQRMDGFVLAGRVWAAGCLLFLAYRLMRLFLAGKTIRRYPPCTDRRIIDMAAQCAHAQKMKRPPRLLETALDAPASVAGVMRPVILVNTDGLSGLTDRQLRIVLTHELTHIKRGHLLFQRIFDFVCVLHWFNPLVWLSRKDFALHCETDCDEHALRGLIGTVAGEEYARTILRLLELSALRSEKSAQGMGALAFVHTRQRMKRILRRSARWRERLLAGCLALLLVLAAAFSLWFSRQHFYPYPAYSVGVEFGAD